MLMHTKVFGHYNGPEEVMQVTDAYTEVNVINNYAPTAKTIVTVVDTEGKPVTADVTITITGQTGSATATVAGKTDRTGQEMLGEMVAAINAKSADTGGMEDRRLKIMAVLGGCTIRRCPAR